MLPPYDVVVGAKVETPGVMIVCPFEAGRIEILFTAVLLSEVLAKSIEVEGLNKFVVSDGYMLGA